MKLHCYVCSMQFTRPSSDTEVAIIDEKALKLPIEQHMFKSLMPERGIPDPWVLCQPWHEMLCPRHRTGTPFAFTFENPEEQAEAVKRGGPSRLPVEKDGHYYWQRIDENGMVEGNPEDPVIETYSDEDLEREWEERAKQYNEAAKNTSFDDRRIRIKELREQNMTYQEIGDEVGLSRTRVMQILKEDG